MRKVAGGVYTKLDRSVVSEKHKQRQNIGETLVL